MEPGVAPVENLPSDPIDALIATLIATEQRLEELTAGQVDTVTDGSGRSLLLRRQCHTPS